MKSVLNMCEMTVEMLSHRITLLGYKIDKTGNPGKEEVIHYVLNMSL